ncbi:hypothetical protein MIR68_002253 [Amoeboaphelidium protococcarum]|nr:hypothetical protein MIR68_002253 [Amoeboaphelidium protococcarum]
MFLKLKNTVNKRQKKEEKEVSITGPLHLQPLREGELAEIVRAAQRLQMQSENASSHEDLAYLSEKAPSTDINDPIRELSLLNDELYSLDITAYTSLRLLLETKLGRGAHVSGAEMKKFNQSAQEIAVKYQQFNEIISECLKNKFRSNAVELSPTSTIVADQDGNEPSYQPTSILMQQSLSSDLSSGVQSDVTQGHTLDLPTAPTLVQQSPQPAFDQVEALLKAKKLQKDMVQLINQVQDAIQTHRSKINPQAIINAQTEIGNTQKFFVRSKYKEMVKGCGPARSAHTGIIAWAGTKDPGDCWMNDLLQAYLRHSIPRHFMESIPVKRILKAKQTGQQSNEGNIAEIALQLAEDTFKEEDMRKRVDLIQTKMYLPQTLDVIELQDLFYWMNEATMRPLPTSHTVASANLVEDAIQKMGGWNLYEVFCVNWLRQFYVDQGKTTIAYPIPGCRPITHESDSTHNQSFASTPCNLSLADLLAPAAATTQALADFNVSPYEKIASNSDQKYWNYIWKQTYKELLMLHKTLQEEMLHDEAALRSYIANVNESGIIQNGKYNDYGIVDEFQYDDSMSKQQKKMLHPKLILLREKSIVLNICSRPEFYQLMDRVDKELRCQSGLLVGEDCAQCGVVPSVPSESSAQSSQILTTDKSGSEGLDFKKGHKKAASTGVFESAGKLFGIKKKSDQVSPSQDQVKKNGTLPFPQRGRSSALSGGGPEDSPVGSRKSALARVQVNEMGQNKRSMSAPATPNFKDSDPDVMDFSELKILSEEILQFPVLPDVSLMKEVHPLSEKIVKYYLTEELPAKKLDRLCVVHDLRCVMENDNLLRDNMDVILRTPRRVNRHFTRPRPPRQSVSRTLPIEGIETLHLNDTEGDENVQEEDTDFSEYPRFTFGEMLNFDNLIETYDQQHCMINQAVSIGEYRERIARMRADHSQPDADELRQRSDFESILSSIIFRLNPEVLNGLINSVKKSCRVGDIIDVCGYRGNGYYYVANVDPDNNVVEAYKTLGDYGCHLPHQAWDIIERYGENYFQSADVWACFLPVDTRIMMHNAAGIQEEYSIHSENSVMFSWLHQKEQVVINGRTYRGKIGLSTNSVSRL